MAFVTPDSGPYLSKLGMKNETYTIKDAWARSEIAEIENAIEGGTHFRGILTSGISGNTLTDNETVKNLYVGASPGTLITVANQKDGDIFIYNNGTENLEFIIADGKYSQLGSAGTFGAFAYADTGAGSAEVNISSAITFNNYTPQVSKGTLGVTYQTGTISINTTATSASGTFSPAAITIPALDVTYTPSTHEALIFGTYDSETATLTIDSTDVLDDVQTMTTLSVTAAQQANQSIAVTYDKANSGSLTALTSASLTGDLAVTAAAPSATITNPTITVTVSPVSS